MHNPLIKLIKIIKTGTPEEVKAAQKLVEKFWHDEYIPNRERGKECFLSFLIELREFDNIKDDNHKAYFVNTLKWPLHVIGEEYFEIWEAFILYCIQHPSGKIRQAIIRATDYLIIDIILEIRSDGKGLEMVKKNKMRFGDFVYRVEVLLEKYYEPRFGRYKYISSVPAGVYKSLQKLMTESLLRSDYYENIYNEFLMEKESYYRNINISDEDIAKRRNELEGQLERLLQEVESDFTVDDIKQIIWEIKKSDKIDKLVRIFDRGQHIEELNRILQILVDAWNYFPHKYLDGVSPTEKYRLVHGDKKND